MADPTRVLAVVSHLRFPSIAVLDRWGLVPLRGSGRNPRAPVAVLGWDLRTWRRRTERVHELLVRIRRALVRFRPALVVLGIAAEEGLFDRELRQRLAALLTELSIPHVVRRIETAWRIMVGEHLQRAAHVLAELLVESVFPQLDSGESGSPRRRWRWYALALALVELARRHPRQAAALLHRDVPHLMHFIQRQELRLHPEV
jgi:hypothetical protein